MASVTSPSALVAGSLPLVESINPNTTTLPPQPPWSVVLFTWSNRNTDSDLTILCNGRHFVIHLSAENLNDSPQLKTKYQFFLEVAENFELDGYSIEDFFDWVIEPFLPIFRELEPAISAHEGSLHAYLFPESLEYVLSAVSEKLTPIPCLNLQSEKLPKIFGVALPDPDRSAWRSFPPAEVRICEEISSGPPSQTPGKVLLQDGTVAYVKLIRRGDKSRLKSELEKYKIIQDATLDASLQISRLIGLVRDESGLVFGLLLTYVSCHNLTLSCAVKPETSPFLRQKWASQVQSTVSQLHEAGIVWGDAKPDNILIDRNEDAWVVDFGGGYTDGWVTKDLAETKQGDLDALQKILGFIGL